MLITLCRLWPGDAHTCVPHCLILLRSIRYLVSASVFQSLVTALVLCRLDYGNSTLVGLPVYLQRRLQSVQNAAARLIFRLRRSDHITDALVSLHWLRAPQRITYKVAVPTYRTLTGVVPVPQYLRQFVHVADVPSKNATIPVLNFRRSDRPGCSSDLHRLSRFSGRRSPHLEHATTARHLCVIVDCI